ncbi:serine hydrolase domain-containing protein [Nonomuraea angiospora]|uniref:serine hydrolase domain-containing protein n=1 Tax=Nonomuraea angiospora TaxID=46172 RepID=UPI003320186B
MNIKQVVTAAALTSIAIATPAWAADQPKQLQRDADALKAAGATGVLAAATTPGGTSAARSGVADLKTGEPVPWNAYYRIGSTTKTFVAAIALQLVGEGKLRLDDTVERWLPGLVEGNGNDGAKITVRQLLGQTSGLPEYADDVPLERVTSESGFRRERFRVYRPEEFVAMAMRHKPAFEPGKGWAYSNTNYVLVGMIIEKVTGTPWQQQLLERVIEPLGLRHTYAPGTSPFLPQPRMTTYKRFTADGPMVDVTTYFPGGTDHSLVSTPDDVNRFFSALLGGRLLRPTELAEMTKTVPATPFRAFWRDAGYGLGIMKRRLPCGGWAWFHGGGGWNAISDNAVTADGRRVASVAYSSALRPDQDPLPQIKASTSLIDHALC